MLKLDGNSLTLQNVVSVAREDEKVELTKAALQRVRNSHENLLKILETGKPVYGINTGYGIFAEKRIDHDDIQKLNRNLILSHAVGTGPELDLEIVRGAMLIRANALSKGFSGVRSEIIHTLLTMLNQNVTPSIPSQGSLGSSGDLCQLSHLALVLSTDRKDLPEESGYAYFKDERLTGKEAMDKAGIKRLELYAKEGLAINNGATFSTSIGCLSLYDAKYLIHIANLALSLSLEALLGCMDAFDPQIHQARNHPGQMQISESVLKMVEGSEFVNTGNRVQDAYSLRCAPQVHGAVSETTEFVETTLEREINAATDNPLIFSEKSVLSGGNFHGEPIGLGMDYLGIAIAELAAISERRSFRLLDGNLNCGLPPMLVEENAHAGLNSGLMMPHYTAASLVLENQTLATPDSVHSLPTSGNQEDHNANAWTAARHARQIIQNAMHVLTIEIFIATRAIDLRMKNTSKKLGIGTKIAYELVRSEVPFIAEDSLWQPQIETIASMIKKRKL
jgi:histidine ammonia-lyase